jgi:cytochrome c553
MRRHRWATDRLWAGIAFVSEQQWDLGVSAFAELPPCQGEAGDEQPARTIASARARTEELRVAAKAASDLDTRARIYGDLLGTCGACHGAGC